MSNPNDPNAQPTPPQYTGPQTPEAPQAPQYAAPAPPQYAPPAAPAAPAAPQYAAQPGYGQPAAAPATNTMAIIALISSFFISLLGVILGHISLGQIKRTGEGGRGLAIAALVIGYIGLAAGIIVAIVWIGVLMSLATVSY